MTKVTGLGRHLHGEVKRWRPRGGQSRSEAVAGRGLAGDRYFLEEGEHYRRRRASMAGVTLITKPEALEAWLGVRNNAGAGTIARTTLL